MLAASNPAIEEAISYRYSLSQDELIRQRCEIHIFRGGRMNA